MVHILLVEDDLSLVGGLTFALKKQGYEVRAARTIREAEAALSLPGAGYDLVILDVALPDGTGYALCQKLRQVSKVPIVFLTAADEETEVIMGLDIGADDYITKPFKLAVFLSKINALLRRSGQYAPPTAVLRSGGIEIDLARGEARKNGAPLELTAGEYRLLRFFLENPGQTLSAGQILGSLWDCDENYINANTLTVYIRRLRTKIEDDPAKPCRIVTVRGLGYQWSASGWGAV